MTIITFWDGIEKMRRNCKGPKLNHSLIIIYYFIVIIIIISTHRRLDILSIY